MDWRKKLDSQKGAVLATEVKNNGFKVAKWTISAILAGSAIIKFGYECDTLEYYNRQFDKVTLKNTAPLQKFKRVFHKIAKENKDCNVFATDAILATLMTSPRSAYSWDIIVQTASMDWCKKLDSQKGAVLATEIKNNGAKWTVSAILTGSAFIKFGYVSQEHPNDSSSHEVLGVQQFKPREFAKQINLNLSNAWGILMTLFLKKEQGKYLILKDPNKPIMRIYKVPKDAFDNDDSRSEDASSDGDD